MEKPKQYIRKYSKETNSEGRTQKAREIKQKRKERRDLKSDVQEQTLRFKQQNENVELLSAEAEIFVGRLKEAEAKMTEFKKTLDKLEASFFSRLKNYFEIQRIREKLGLVQKEKLDIEQKHISLDGSILQSKELRRNMEKNLIDRQESLRELSRPGEKDLVMDFYEEEKKRWREQRDMNEIDLSYFDADTLSSMTIEDYVKNWRDHGGASTITHVSRRGIRSHGRLSEHQAGMGEFHDSFDRLLESRSLKSALALTLEGEKRFEYIADVLGFTDSDTYETAIQKLDKYLNFGGYRSVWDHAGVHFAIEDVANQFYGSEVGNECFVIFPSTLIAKEYSYSDGIIYGDINDISGASIDEIEPKHNDVWVWSKEQRGMPIDAGIVFLPKNAQVNPKTGSRFKLDSENKPTINTEVESLVDRVTQDFETKDADFTVENFIQHIVIPSETFKDTFRDFETFLNTSADMITKDDTFESFVVKSVHIFNILDKKVMEKLGFDQHNLTKEQRMEFSELQQIEKLKMLKKIHEKAKNFFGITDIRITEAFATREGCYLLNERRNEFQKLKKYGKESREYFVASEMYKSARHLLIGGSGMRFIEENVTISSQEYWNDYFKKFPERKPSKIVYYEGSDPMASVQKFRLDNGITREDEHVYNQKRETSGTQISSENIDRFRSIALEIIARKYTSKS